MPDKRCILYSACRVIEEAKQIVGCASTLLPEILLINFPANEQTDKMNERRKFATGLFGKYIFIARVDENQARKMTTNPEPDFLYQ